MVFVVGLAIFLGVAALLVLSIVVRGFVFSYLWSWFVVPVFSVPELTISTAIGLGMVVAFFTTRTSDYVITQKSSSDDIARAFTSVLISPFITLFFAWIVTWFL